MKNKNTIKIAWIAHDWSCMTEREKNKLIPVIRKYNGKVIRKNFPTFRKRETNRKYSRKCIPVNPTIKHKFNYCGNGKRKTIKKQYINKTA